jgi:hypothetical protein
MKKRYDSGKSIELYKIVVIHRRFALKSASRRNKIMHRYVLYFVVGLLAFGIGSGGFYLYFYQVGKTDDKSTVRTEEDKRKAVLQFVNTEQMFKFNTVPEKDFLTNKEKASILFEPTINKWLNQEKINDAVEPATEIIEKIKEGKYSRVDESELTGTAQISYKPSLIDVNGDGKDELAVLANCLDEASCELWILQRTAKDFKVILSTYNDVGQFKLQKNKTKGYFNIETTRSYRANELFLQMNVLKFGDGEYYGADCFDYEYRYKDKNGKLQNLKKPKLHRLHCC